MKLEVKFFFHKKFSEEGGIHVFFKGVKFKTIGMEANEVLTKAF